MFLFWLNKCGILQAFSPTNNNGKIVKNSGLKTMCIKVHKTEMIGVKNPQRPPKHIFQQQHGSKPETLFFPEHSVPVYEQALVFKHFHSTAHVLNKTL